MRGPNQSSDPMFYVHYLKINLKWMAFDAIESVFIYLWLEIILQKYGKGAKYFDNDCLKFLNRIFWEIGGTFQHNLPLFGEKSPFWNHFNTKKSG